jgi:acyl-CoA synthetase (AMP-forming)/AMP-acid ligase II
MIATHPQARRLADSPVEVVALGAEPATIADVRAVRELFPRARLFNRYGPTETVIAVSHVLLTDDLVSDGVIPIGRPHPGVTFHIVGEDGSLIESPGVVGELYIGGRQLMTEYWGAPDLSESVIRRDIVPGDVLYRTGDLVYNDEARGLVYVDRSDLVVKRNGVRISLLELRDAIERAPGVSRAACVEFDDSSRVGIAAFAVRSGNVDQSDLAAAIGGIVPSSMLPDRYIFVDAFPLTSSGKLDERQLLADAGLEPRVSAGVVRVTRDVPTRHSSSPREPS